MKNTVSFETAKAMKKAGLPQPEPAPGQFWYNERGEIHVVYTEGADGCCFIDMNSGDAQPYAAKEVFVFAPQAHDILALDDSLKFWHINYEKVFACKIWVVVDGRLTSRIVTDENPHEAAAHGFMGNEYEGWIATNAKK